MDIYYNGKCQGKRKESKKGIPDMSRKFDLAADYDFLNVVSHDPTCIDCGYVLGTNEGLVTGLCNYCEEDQELDSVDVWGEDIELDEEGLKYLAS